MKDEALDFLPMILLLGLVVSISFNLIMPIYKTSVELQYSESYDKTFAKVEGEQHKYDNSVLNGLTYEEMVLHLAAQTYFMPNPRVLDVGGEVFAIQPGAVTVTDPNAAYTATPTDEYVPNNRATLENVRVALNDWCTRYTTRYGKDGHNLVFAIRFTTGTIEGPTDDCYALYVKVVDGVGNEYWSKCLANGYIDQTVANGQPIYAKMLTKYTCSAPGCGETIRIENNALICRVCSSEI